jgi:tetratricopeptide (TPR) repeat protein
MIADSRYVRTFLLAVGVVVAVSCSSPETSKLRYLESGNKYADAGRYEHAIIEYRNAVRLDPKFGEARYRLAQAFERTNNLEAAFPEYVRAADALPDRRDVQLKAIDVLVLLGRFEEAKGRANALLKKDPNDVDALVMLANAMSALKDADGAIGQIEEALRVRPNDSSTFINLGAIRFRSGDVAQAESAFKQAVKLAPSSVTAHLALANYLWATGRAAETEDAIKHAVSLEPEHVLANRMLAALYIATKRPDLAEQPLLTVVRASSTPSSRLMLADYYTGTQRHDEAIRLLKELSGDPQASADAESRLAAIDYVQGRRAEAHQRLDAVLGRAPGHAAVLTMKAQWLAAENRLDDALVRAKAAVVADPQSAVARYILATIHDLRLEVADAVGAYNEVLRLNPRAANAQVQLSRLSLASGKKDAAVHYAEGAKQTEPGNYQARAALARSLLASGDFGRAEAEISELLKQRPTEAGVHSLAGMLQSSRGNPAGARQSFERALELSPGLVEALSGLVALDIAAKQVEAAVARVEFELAKTPDRPPLLALAAHAYGASGSLPRAEAALRRAVTIDPQFSAGYSLLARLYLAQRRLDEARVEFEGMARRDPSAVEARTMVGVLLEMQNRRADARKWYEETLSISEAPVAANNLAVIYADEGINLDAALQLAVAAKQALPDNPAVDDTLGWVYYKKGLASLAIRPLEDSVRKSPNSVNSLYHLGLSYAKVGESAKARETLDRALKLNPNFAGADVARSTMASLAR